MNAQRIIQAAIPTADEELIEFLLWERTPYPVGGITPRSVYRAASRFARAQKNGRRLCHLCDNALKPAEKWVCGRCERALNRNREA